MIAVTRFPAMLVVLFAIRTSLDVFKVDAFGTGGLEPGTVVGAVFLVAAIAWLLTRRRRSLWVRLSRTSAALLVFAGAVVLSSVGAEMPLQSLQQATKPLSVALMLVVLEQLFRWHPEYVRPILAAILASLVVPAAVGYLQLRGIEPVEAYDAIGVGRVQGTFVHPNSFAVYLGIIVVLCIALLPYVTPGWRRAMVAAVAVAAPLVLFTYARGGWIAILVGLLFVGLTQTRLLVFVLLTGVVLVVLMVPSVSTRLADLERARPRHEKIEPNSLSWRLGYWGRVLPLGTENPVTGIGFEMVREKMPERLPPHNAFIEAFVETGAAGLAALIAVIAALWADLRRAARRLRGGFGRGMAVAAVGVSVTVLVQMFSENLLSQPVLLWYLVAPVAWVLAVGRASEALVPEEVPATVTSVSAS